MKLKDLKKMLDKMSAEQLENPLYYKGLYISGIATVQKSKSNLWYDGEHDPSTLKTMADLKERYEKHEIDKFSLEIPKGSLMVIIPNH